MISWAIAETRTDLPVPFSPVSGTQDLFPVVIQGALVLGLYEPRYVALDGLGVGVDVECGGPHELDVLAGFHRHLEGQSRLEVQLVLRELLEMCQLALAPDRPIIQDDPFGVALEALPSALAMDINAVGTQVYETRHHLVDGHPQSLVNLRGFLHPLVHTKLCQSRSNLGKDGIDLAMELMDLFRDIQQEGKSVETESCRSENLEDQISVPSLPWNSKLYATQQYTPYHRRTLGRNPPQELDTVYHLEPHRFGLRNVLVVRLCSIMRVEEPSQVLRALGDTIELLARALVEANNGLLPDLLYGRG